MSPFQCLKEHPQVFQKLIIKNKNREKRTRTTRIRINYALYRTLNIYLLIRIFHLLRKIIIFLFTSI